MITILVFIIIIPILRAFDAEPATLRPPAELSVTHFLIHRWQTLPDATPRCQQCPIRALQRDTPPAAFDWLLPHLRLIAPTLFAWECCLAVRGCIDCYSGRCFIMRNLRWRNSSFYIFPRSSFNCSSSAILSSSSSSSSTTTTMSSFATSSSTRTSYPPSS